MLQYVTPETLTFLSRKSTRVFYNYLYDNILWKQAWRRPALLCKCLRGYGLTCPQRFSSSGGGVAAGGSLRSSL